MTRAVRSGGLPPVPATLLPDADDRQRRLTDRADRMTAVVAELRLRARHHAAEYGEVPAPLSLAIRDFGAELRSLRRELDALER